jgi:hypothetical protein
MLALSCATARCGSTRSRTVSGFREALREAASYLASLCTDRTVHGDSADDLRQGDQDGTGGSVFRGGEVTASELSALREAVTTGRGLPLHGFTSTSPLESKAAKFAARAPLRPGEARAVRAINMVENHVDNIAPMGWTMKRQARRVPDRVHVEVRTGERGRAGRWC